ncbi:MAG: hypothetical protein HKN74_09230 [Acidimicrobiia bacterium]|nr:hypothetical protein [Acidimicrobiia bacterium]NNL69483.1 hypothetical protein [Acidimicrobiia bacterium]
MTRFRNFAAPLLAVGFAAALVFPHPVGAVASSGTVIIPADRIVEEDLFAGAARVIVEGTIRGDLTVTTRELIVNGTVEGDVNGIAWTVRIGGDVAGSVRAVAWQVDVTGSVGDDVLSVARSVEVDGTVGRDVLLAAISARNSGAVGGEIRGDLLWGLYVDGTVAEDIDVGVHRLTITESASVGSAVSWRQGLIGQNVRGWTARTDISPDADLGLVTEVRPIPADLSYRALRALFNVLRFVGVVFLGVVLIAAFPRPTGRATDRAWLRPATSFLVGLGLFVGVPVAVVLSLFTIILAPLGLLALGFWAFGLFVGAVPPLIALGRRARRRPSSMMGAFVVAAIGWRLLRLIPLAGFAIYLVVTMWGMGAWATALWEAWRDRGDAEPVLARAALPEPGPRLELLGLAVPGSNPPPADPPPPEEPAG